MIQGRCYISVQSYVQDKGWKPTLSHNVVIEHEGGHCMPRQSSSMLSDQLVLFKQSVNRSRRSCYKIQRLEH